MAILSIDIMNGDELVTRINAGIDALDDFGPLFDAVTRAWFVSRRRMFDSQGFGRWPMYNRDERRAYVPYKERQVGRRIGVRDLMRFDAGTNALRLYKSLTRNNSDAHVVTDPQRKVMELGTSVPYAADNRRSRTGWLGIGTAPARAVLSLPIAGMVR